ncbi:hypothetical protein NQU17_08300 [Clostridiaceae bacterium HFYG-1003]|nr:hypothetical protein NQU17_08300 [Clostridiaceae bacterium HFYG-1003]
MNQEETDIFVEFEEQFEVKNKKDQNSGDSGKYGRNENESETVE